MRRALAAAAVAATALVAVHAGVSASSQSASRLVRLAPGDQVSVGGTQLRCSVSASGGPTTIVCGVGGTGGPRSGSFSFAVADSALLVLKASQTGSAIEVARRAEPALGGTAFLGSGVGGKSRTVAAGAVLTVTGTHVFCAVPMLSGKPYVTCGISTGGGAFVTKSYVGIASETQLLLVQKLSETATKTVLVREQPTK